MSVVAWLQQLSPRKKPSMSLRPLIAPSGQRLQGQGFNWVCTGKIRMHNMGGPKGIPHLMKGSRICLQLSWLVAYLSVQPLLLWLFS